jgi:hypothetical protein
LCRYRGILDRRLGNTINNFKGALPCFAFTGLALLGAVFYANVASTNYVQGSGQGGNFLNILTPHSEADLAYNREFQKARSLTEQARADGSTNTSGYLLADLGIAESNSTPGHYTKRAPNKKYY